MGRLVDLAAGGFVTWMIYPQIRQTIVDNAGSHAASIVTVVIAISVYAVLVSGILYLLRHNERLRRFSTVGEIS